ncbi:MAG: hypothetical protein AAF909_13595, partial [Pseudomonadota bacterium]
MSATEPAANKAAAKMAAALIARSTANTPAACSPGDGPIEVALQPWSDLELQQRVLEAEAAGVAASAQEDPRAGRGRVAWAHAARLQDAIVAYLAEADAANPTRRPVAAKLLARVGDVAEAAAVTLETALAAATAERSLAASAVALSERLEENWRLRRLRRAERRLFRGGASAVDGAPERRARLRRLARRAMRSGEGDARPAWTAREKLLLGVALLDLAQSATGLIETSLAKRRGGRMTQRVVSPTQAALAALRDAETRAALGRRAREPMITPPVPWSGDDQGGYLTLQGPPLRLVKTRFWEKAATGRRWAGPEAIVSA